MELPLANWAVNFPFPSVGLGVDWTRRKPPPVELAATGGSCCSTEAGTVKVPRPAVVVQRKEVVSIDRFAPLPVLVVDDPLICTISVELPPVQFSVRPAMRLIVAGSPPVIVRAEP